MAGDPDYPQWISFDLGDERKINRIKLAFGRDDDHHYIFEKPGTAKRKK